MKSRRLSIPLAVAGMVATVLIGAGATPTIAQSSTANAQPAPSSAQPTTVATGPLEAERKKLVERIHSLEKEHRIGTAPYLHAFSEIESGVTSGKSEEELKKEIARLDASISEQMANAARQAAAEKSSNSRLGPLPVPPSATRSSASASTAASSQTATTSPLTAYCKKVSQAFQDKLTVSKALDGLHMTFSIDAAGNISNVQHTNLSRRSIETDRLFTQLTALRKMAPPPPEIVAKAPFKLMLIFCPTHNCLEVGLQEVDFPSYKENMKLKVKKTWVPPRGAESLQVTCTFIVGSDGSISNLKVEPTGNPLADEAAKKALNSASPFGPLPDGSLPHVETRFVFDYNKQKDENPRAQYNN